MMKTTILQFLCGVDIVYCLLESLANRASSKNANGSSKRV